MGKNSTVLIQEFMLLYKLDSNKIKTWQWTVFKSKYVNTSKDNACGIQHFWNKNENYYLNNKSEGKSVKCISVFFSVHGSCSLHDQFEACFSKPIRIMVLSSGNLSKSVSTGNSHKMLLRRKPQKRLWQLNRWTSERFWER